MRQESGKWLVAGVTVGLVGLLGTISWRAAAQESPTDTTLVSDPASTYRPNTLTVNSRPGISYTNTMAFRFENVTVDLILAEMSTRFGFIITKTAAIPNRVTIMTPNPVHADEAVRLLNDVLVPIGYATLETHTGEGAEAKTSLRVAGLAEVKKANVPVFVSGDPAVIEMSNTVITQIIPLRNIDAVRLRSDLMPLMSADADVAANPAANALIITDASAKIHRLAEITLALDKLAAERPQREPAPAGNGLPAGMTVIDGAAIASGPMAAGAYRHGLPGQGEVLGQRVAIVAPADGVLEKVLASDGAEVKAGQMIALMDTRREQAELAAARAKVELARAELARIQASGAAGDVAVAQAHVAVEEAQVVRCQEAIRMREIRSPFDGMLTQVAVRPGEAVRAGVPLTEVVGKEELKLAFKPPRLSEAGELKVGTKFAFRVTGAPKDFECEVSFVPPQGVVGTDLPWRARFLGSIARLKPGMQGTILAVLAEDEYPPGGK